MREREAASINMTKEWVVILVKLRVALSRHASVTHHDIYTVRNMDFHLPSGEGTLINPQTVIEVVGDTCRVCAARLAFSGERVQDFVLCVGAQALFEIN